MSTTVWGFKSGKDIDDCEYPQVKGSNECPEGDLPPWDTHLRHLAPGLARSVSSALSSENVRNRMVATVLAVGERDMMRMPTRSRSCARARGPKHQSARDRYGPAQ